MIKTLQKKFVLITMTSLFAVLLMIVGGINLINLNQMNQKADGLLEMLSHNDGKFPDMKKDKDKNKAETEIQNSNQKEMKDKNDTDITLKPQTQNQNSHVRFTEETPFETRYFFIRTDGENNIIELDTGHIAAVSSSDAREYAEKVIDGGKQTGYLGSYKYLVSGQTYGSMILFVDFSQQIQSSLSLLLVSGGVAFFSLLVMFILVSVFSRRAVRPVIESMEKQKQFITDAGHEIKTPLAIISANTDVLELSSGKNEWTDSIKNQTRRLNGLVKNLLELSKMEENRSKLIFSNFSLSNAVKDTVEPFQMLAETKGKEVISNIGENINMYGEEGTIRQLISILVDNAVKYADPGGKVNIMLIKSGKGIRLEVWNTCRNIPEGNLDMLFDRFYRADCSRTQQTGGYGIGLSIAKVIVEAHKGKISAGFKDKNVICFKISFNNSSQPARKLSSFTI